MLGGRILIATLTASESFFVESLPHSSRMRQIPSFDYAMNNYLRHVIAGERAVVIDVAHAGTFFSEHCRESR